MITLGRRGDLRARRQAVAFLRSKDVVHKLFTEVAPQFEGRPGGYLRIVKLGPRPGDAAEMAYLELVDSPLVFKTRLPLDEYVGARDDDETETEVEAEADLADTEAEETGEVEDEDAEPEAEAEVAVGEPEAEPAADDAVEEEPSAEAEVAAEADESPAEADDEATEPDSR